MGRGQVSARTDAFGEWLAYGTDEAVEGKDAFLQKRDPDWSPYPWHY